MIRSPWCVRAFAEGGGVRVVARDWPFAGWFAAACALPSVPLLAWSVADGRAIEGGGAAVLTGIAAFSAWLALSSRREVVVSPAAGPAGLSGAVRVRGTAGIGPCARAVDEVLSAAEVVVEPFPAPPGAPDLPDRGGDLVLAGGGARVHLARAAGRGWRERLGAAEQVLRAALLRSAGTSLRS